MPPAKTTTTTETTCNILLVDDNANNLRLLSQMLIEQGYRVRAVLNGARALAAVASTTPDLILLDIMMPEMDGYEVCERLKADPDTRDIPIIFISALDATEDKVRALNIGGVDYVTKPLQVEEVMARVKTHLSLQQLRRELEVTNRELAQRLEELDQANAQLRERNEELAAYDHSVSHDLKNPVGLILTSAEWLERLYPKLSRDEIGVILQGITRNAHKANTIIESLLLLAEPEAVVQEPLDMVGIVHAVCDSLKTMISEYEATVDIPETLPVALGESVLVERVWDNYISNAIKYGGEPPHLEIGGAVHEGNTVRLWVRDNGPGLSPDQQAQLFNAFTRLTDGKIQGHGLGLSIARRIVARLGGEVGVESEIGAGSTFYFELPRATPETV